MQNLVGPICTIYDISAQHNRRRSKSEQVKIGAAQNLCRSKLAQVKIGTGQNQQRKNEPTWLYDASQVAASFIVT